jgi:hypothetical protein
VEEVYTERAKQSKRDRATERGEQESAKELEREREEESDRERERERENLMSAANAGLRVLFGVCSVPV